MSDLFLYLAGTLGVLISAMHGYLGERKVIGSVQSISGSRKRILSAVMFLSAVYWGIASLLLLAAPTYIPEVIRPYVIIGVATVFISGSLGNLWATRGRHFGWVFLAITAGLALAGL